MDKSTRLPRNFHRTFIPERQYIHALLRFAASGKSGDYQEISAITGIPMGKSIGKVPAIMDYSRGMGLIRLVGGNRRSSVKQPELTPFGRIVFLEDPHLKEPVTQWLAHFHLCGVRGGAEAWYQTFFAGSQPLGKRFSRGLLEEHLSFVFQTKRTGIIGPLIRMYEDKAAFSNCGVLSESAGMVNRKTAPITDEFGFAYGAWVLQLLTEHFPKVHQVTLTELDRKAGWRTIPGWNINEINMVISLMERKRLLDVDRQMDPWIVRPLARARDVWAHIYDDLI